jgi:ADP-ribose pyrophosphatase YjhB (NUDIX family)
MPDVCPAGPMSQSFVFCPRCSAPLAEGVRFGRTRRFCRYCGFIHFSDPKVAVAGLVSDGVRVLLVRRAAVPRIGFWALPAGYMDADELPEEAVVREIAEETGVEVRVTGLHGITALAGWNKRRGILVVYQAEPVGGALLAGDDVSDACWFSAGEIPWDELAFESTAEFLKAWAAQTGRTRSPHTKAS